MISILSNFLVDVSSGLLHNMASSFDITIPALTLPWAEKYWNLYITHCVSTIEIWGRIFGKDYSDQFDNLLTDIDMYMLTNKSRPVSVLPKQVYLVCVSDCWHRVRLEEVDKVNGVGLCFFIDFGDQDWLAVNQLHICEKQFLKLPPQAVHFSLYGLEDFAGNPNAKRHLDATLELKSLVADILTKEEQIIDTNDDVIGGLNKKIQVVVYDTSSDEDVNLNSLILNSIVDDTPAPEIKSNGLVNAVITYVTEAGDLYLQVRSSDLQYIQVC